MVDIEETLGKYRNQLIGNPISSMFPYKFIHEIDVRDGIIVVIHNTSEGSDFTRSIRDYSAEYGLNLEIADDF